MFRINVVFKLQIRAGIGTSLDDAWFSRVVQLPFVPPVGMEVIDGEWSGIVDSLAYKDGAVFAFVEGWGTHKRRPPDEMAAEIADAESIGWVRSKGILSV